MRSAAGPENTSSSTNGETATTGVRSSAASIPGTASIGPILVTGFEGPMTTGASRASITGVVAHREQRAVDVEGVGEDLRGFSQCFALVEQARSRDVDRTVTVADGHEL